ERMLGRRPDHPPRDAQLQHVAVVGEHRQHHLRLHLSEGVILGPRKHQIAFVKLLDRLTTFRRQQRRPCCEACPGGSLVLSPEYPLLQYVSCCHDLGLQTSARTSASQVIEPKSPPSQ